MAVAGFLLLAVVLVFGQTVRHEFINYDDDKYVYENPNIFRGFTASGVAWVFTQSHVANWHPLTGLSHLLDCQLYGLNAGRHHLTNLLLHAAATVLLFLVLQWMTGRFWPSALVAALFAIHPLRVESVAWVAERKDVLSGLLFVMAMGAYAWYVRGPFSWGRYLLLLLITALGLLAKPMLVTLPFVFLLLDYWPLGRMVPGDRKRRWLLVMEKLPLLILVVISSALTVWAQQKALVAGEHLSFGCRVGNAIVAYAAYLVQIFFPFGLAVYYPHPGVHLAVWKILGALILLLSISGAAITYRRRWPYLLVGWLWYLGMLVPVIGLVQVGTQSMADRYTYLPQIGLYLALAWAASDACRAWPAGGWMCRIASVLALTALMGCAWRQTTFWRDSETIWTHALSCTPPNPVAYDNLGNALVRKNRFDEAIAKYQEVLNLKPDDSETYSNLGVALARTGRYDEAVAQYRKALEIAPENIEALCNLGYSLAGRGRYKEAIMHYRRALEINPDHAKTRHNLGIALAACGQTTDAIDQYRKAIEIDPYQAEAYNNLGLALQRQGRPDEAIACYQRAIEIKPNLVVAHNNLGIVSADRGQFQQAVDYYRQALKLNPNYAEAHNNLALLQATCPEVAVRNGAKAVEHARRANQLFGGKQPVVLNTLAAAYAEAGRFPEALAVARQALNLAIQQNNSALANTVRARIALYETGKSYRQAP